VDRRLSVAGWIAGCAAVASATTFAAAGLTPRRIPGYGISVDLPRSWVGAAPPAAASAFGVKYAFRASDAVSGFRANLNVIVAPLPAGTTLREWFFGGISSAYQYVGTTRPFTVDGAHGLSYESTKATKYRTLPLLVEEYAVVRDGHVFVFTYTALASTRSSYGDVFSASARSIRLTAHPLTPVKA